VLVGERRSRAVSVRRTFPFGVERVGRRRPWTRHHAQTFAPDHIRRRHFPRKQGIYLAWIAAPAANPSVEDAGGEGADRAVEWHTVRGKHHMHKMIMDKQEHHHW
jgi:hypothetical protein